MSLAFDTSILIEIEKENKEILKRLQELRGSYPLPVQLPFISYYEFLRGLKIGNPKNYDELMDFLNSFNVLRTTNKTADILSDLRIKYDGLGIILNLADLLIASQAIENQLIVVTRDKDFEKIQEVKKIIL